MSENPDLLERPNLGSFTKFISLLWLAN
jgi:hypothetical protein